MGSSGSMIRGNDDIVKKIPIEVKPRKKLGNALRSVGSFGRRQKGSSLRSALSVDIEEVEKIRKDFEMFKLNKENELASTQKKSEKLESENKRLRNELQALQKTCSKLRMERDSALDAEYQALERAGTFENERDKIQRQFKIFRETKEKEMQNLLNSKRELDSKINNELLVDERNAEDSLPRSANDSAIGGNHSSVDWGWTGLETDQSLSSTLVSFHNKLGPEYAHGVIELEGPFMNVNKGDWNAASASLTQILPPFTDFVLGNIMVYVSTTPDMCDDFHELNKTCLSRLQQHYEQEGRAFTIIHFSDDKKNSNKKLQSTFQIRQSLIQRSTVFLGLIGDHCSKSFSVELNSAYVQNPGSKPCVFVYRGQRCKSECKSGHTEIQQFKAQIKENSNIKVLNVMCNIAKSWSCLEDTLQGLINKVIRSDEFSSTRGINEYDSDNPATLCGINHWDLYGDSYQLEILDSAARCLCMLGFEKHFERLNGHINAAGPLPPLLVCGSSGSGKSLLLAKWLLHLLEKQPTSLVLYHFVTDENSCDADPVFMLSRLTFQLMQYGHLPPALTSDPMRIVEEFPHWLERISSKQPAGIVVVIDSMHKFKNAELNMKWLLDPLPVDTRIIVSVDEETCPQAWRAWPTINLEPLSNRNVREFLHAASEEGLNLTTDQEAKVLTRCRSSATTNPLYVVLLTNMLLYNDPTDIDGLLEYLLSTDSTLELYECILVNFCGRYKNAEDRELFRKILQYVYASRNGVSESELFELLPSLTWNFWVVLSDNFLKLSVLKNICGLLNFAQDEVRKVVRDYYFQDPKALNNCRMELVEFHKQRLLSRDLCLRAAEELPHLLLSLGDTNQLQDLLSKLSIFRVLYARGRSSELLGYWQHLGVERSTMAAIYFTAIKKLEEESRQDDSGAALSQTADVYEALGRFLKDICLLKQAVTALQRALEVREMALDPDHPSVAQVLHQLAGLHGQWGKYSTAEALCKQALDVYENAFGKDHCLIARELETLAMLYQKQDKLDLAEPLHKRAKAIRQKLKLPGDISCGQRMDYVKKKLLKLEGLAVEKATPELARALNELGVLFYLQNNQQMAENLFQRSLEIRESLLGPDHADCAQSLYNLAALNNDNKKYDKAETLYERALVIRNKVCPSNHQAVASVIKHLAMVYKKQKKYEKAEPLYRQAVSIREETFGESHPSVATALVNLAVLYCEMGNYSLALPLYTRALHIFENMLGQDHPRVAETLKNMALLYYEQGDYEAAARHYKRATNIKENNVPDSSTD